MLQNLIMSLPRRIDAVIKAKGGNIKYWVLTFVISMYTIIKAVVCHVLDKFENCQCRLEKTQISYHSTRDTSSVLASRYQHTSS